MTGIARSVRRGLPAFLGLALAGCDNIKWGGSEFAVVPPPPTNASPATGTEIEGERMPEGPVLYYVANSPDGAIMVPVGEISGDSMLPLRARGDPAAYAQRFIAEHMRQGAEFVLYREGMRVGTLVVRSSEPPAANVCPALPRARGATELIPAAVQVPEFLAIPSQYAPEIRRRAAEPPKVTSTMQLLGPILAERMLRARQAPLPSNWQRAMKQLRPIPVSGTADAGITATFLVGDSLGVGQDNEGYSLFFVGIPAQFSYDTVFVQFSNYPQQGKAAPRIIDFLDWNRDDQPEVLLQVFGTNDSWFESVGRRQDNRWHRTFQDRCQRGQGAIPQATVPDSLKRDTVR